MRSDWRLPQGRAVWLSTARHRRGLPVRPGTGLCETLPDQVSLTPAQLLEMRRGGGPDRLSCQVELADLLQPGRVRRPGVAFCWPPAIAAVPPADVASSPGTGESGAVPGPRGAVSGPSRTAGSGPGAGLSCWPGRESGTQPA